MLSNTNTVVGQWHHFAVVRSGSTIKLYQDGVEVASVTNSDLNVTNIGQPVYIGGNPQISGEWFNGSIDDIRITKGVARYTSNFTPSIYPFPNS